MNSRLAKLYVKQFLLYFFIFGALMSAWEYYDSGEVNILKQVVISIIYAALMTWAYVTAKRKARSKKEKDQFEYRKN